MLKNAVEICKYKSSHGEAVVAVKRLRHNMLKNKEELANFVEECKLLRKLSNRCPETCLPAPLLCASV
jgi:hypothetical protein